MRKQVPDPAGLRAARAAACPRSAFAEFLLGGAQVGKVGLVAVAFDLASDMGQKIRCTVTSEACADTPIGRPHQPWDANGRGWRVTSQNISRRPTVGQILRRNLCSYKVRIGV